MKTMLILSILLATSFTGVAIWRKRTLPESISSLVYVFRWRWMWTVWLTAVGILTCAPAIEILDRIGMGFLGFGTLVCLVFCAAMPIFMEEQKQWHDILGIFAGVMTQVIVAIVSPAWLTVWMAFLFIIGSVYVQPEGKLAKAVKGKVVFIAEVVCYIALVGALAQVL